MTEKTQSQQYIKINYNLLTCEYIYYLFQFVTTEVNIDFVTYRLINFVILNSHILKYLEIDKCLWICKIVYYVF